MSLYSIAEGEEKIMNEKQERYDHIYKLTVIIGTILIFLSTFYLSTTLLMKHAPDEYMRIQIPQWIFKHNALPHGDEKELLNKYWGFSYGFTPYLPSLISVFFMKLASLFSKSSHVLLVAARFVSVLSITLLWIICTQIGDRLFKKRTMRILFAVLCCSLPQFIFISSYLNNDAFGVMCTGLIVLAWLIGDQDGWTIKRCLFLAIPIGLLAITYYNDYAFILCSILFFFVSIIQQKKPTKMILQYTLFIVLIVFLICGWFFIRNAIIHNGDLLGMKSMYACGEKYAMEIYKPSQRHTLARQQLNFYDAFIKTKWFKFTIYSFIGYFGYLTVVMPQNAYITYKIFILILLILTIIRSLIERKIPKKLFLCLLICIIIPLLLSMYYSYFTDFQAQGRYIMSALIPLMIFSTYGLDGFITRFEKKLKIVDPLVSIISIGFPLVFSMYACFIYLIPKCCS